MADFHIPDADHAVAGMIRHKLLGAVTDWAAPVSVVVQDALCDGEGVRIRGATRAQVLQAIDDALEHVAAWRARLESTAG